MSSTPFIILGEMRMKLGSGARNVGATELVDVAPLKLNHRERLRSRHLCVYDVDVGSPNEDPRQDCSPSSIRTVRPSTLSVTSPVRATHAPIQLCRSSRA